jgi:fibronectin type 3 domain-containing protein
MRRILTAGILGSILILGACSKDHTDLPTGFAYTPPETPTNFQVAAGAESATLTWDYPADALGAIQEFRIYYHIEAFDVLELIGTTDETTYTDDKLVGNLTYCYSISAVDTTGLEGWRLEPICVFVTSR